MSIEKIATDSGTAKPAVPDYDDVVDRNEITLLTTPGDLAVVNGDLALTRRGDLMMTSPDYHAFFRLVNWWRFNFPVLSVMFDSVFPLVDDVTRLDQALKEQFAIAAKKSPHPMTSLDYDAYHRINDERGAVEVARGVYAGAIVVALSNALQSFRADIEGVQHEWDAAVPRFAGCSFGQVVVASANNVRHADEWQTARPPTARQLQSMRVLSAVLNEPLDPADGSRHRFGREVSPEVLQAICGGKMARLEENFFDFAKDLFLRREQRNLP
ncbi:hypothetical protein LGM71_29320 [Burkholderia sp. AU33545]|uniref:hypothetical protein n=1 Tax=Burkholderia sp. AU33545 TaxID=2879631 RepID=UPI001CF0E695|nr:hypothetical protein [Burkholderia sp. AU33545]MCA8205143.1 hypothetical protein [Burkholderia sp. AU33545]